MFRPFQGAEGPPVPPFLLQDLYRETHQTREGPSVRLSRMSPGNERGWRQPRESADRFSRESDGRVVFRHEKGGTERQRHVRELFSVDPGREFLPRMQRVHLHRVY